MSTSTRPAWSDDCFKPAPERHYKGKRPSRRLVAGQLGQDDKRQRRLLPRRASTRTRQRTGWASGAAPRSRNAPLAPTGEEPARGAGGACRTDPARRPARPRRASQCASRRSATSASYRRHHQWRRRQSRKRQRRRRRRRPWRRRRILAASAADTSAATSTRRGPRACSLGTSWPTRRPSARGDQQHSASPSAPVRALRRPAPPPPRPAPARHPRGGAVCRGRRARGIRPPRRAESKRTVANDNRNTDARYDGGKDFARGAGAKRVRGRCRARRLITQSFRRPLLMRPTQFAAVAFC